MTNPETRIEYHGKSDDLGRCHFSLHWVRTDPNRETGSVNRSQHFFADPHTHGHLRPEEVVLP